MNKIISIVIVLLLTGCSNIIDIPNLTDTQSNHNSIQSGDSMYSGLDSIVDTNSGNTMNNVFSGITAQEIINSSGIDKLTYNLFNIEDDFVADKNCDGFGDESETCNIYQHKDNDDASIRNIITLMKLGNFRQAASITNNITNNPSIYPDVIGNISIYNLGVVPYGSGLLGVQQMGHDINLRFYYITIVNNQLIKYISKYSMWMGSLTDEGSNYNIVEHKTNNDIITIQTPRVCPDLSGLILPNTGYALCRNSRRLEYLKGTQTHNTLDIFKQQFLNQIE